MAARTRQDWQRWARKGTTTQRGYGASHQSERERRLKQYRPGDLCAHCGQAITWWPLNKVTRRYIHLPHNADRTGYLPGLAHSYCNLRDGQARTTAILNARRGRTGRAWQTSRVW
jgi:hypothetical protein